MAAGRVVAAVMPDLMIKTGSTIIIIPWYAACDGGAGWKCLRGNGIRAANQRREQKKNLQPNDDTKTIFHGVCKGGMRRSQCAGAFMGSQPGLRLVTRPACGLTQNAMRQANDTFNDFMVWVV